MADQKAPAKNEEARPYLALMKELWDVAETEEGFTDSFDIASMVIDNILSATTFDEIVEANESGSLDKAEKYLNKPINITTISFRKSAEKFRKGTLGVYAVIDGHTDDGEVITFGVGAPNVVASLRKCQTLGLISEAKPLRCSIKSRETANGELYTLGKAA